MIDYTVKRYSKELNWAIEDVLIAIDTFDRNFPYYDTSRMLFSLQDLETLVNSIVVFPGLDIKWSDYHRNIEKLILFDSRVSLERRLKSWYIFKYKSQETLCKTQRTLKFKLDLMKYLNVLKCVVNSMVKFSETR